MNQNLMPGVHIGKRQPNGKIDWTPPNRGQYLIRHVDTFINRYTSLSNVYRDYDEALIDNRDNARAMRQDLGIRECIDSRQRSVALLNWHLEPDDEASHDQREFCALLEHVIRGGISHFYEFRRNLQHAIWYGKYGIIPRWGVKDIRNRSYYVPKGRHQDDWGWRPLHGDKIVFRQLRSDADLPAGSYEGQMGIRVGYRYEPDNIINNRWKIEATDYGLAYFLTPAERRLIFIHKHSIEDASYDDGLRAGSIYGVGIRSVIYWEWFQCKSTMAFLMEFVERMAGGIQIWKYPLGNKQAEEGVRQAAENYNSGEEHILLVPVPPGEVGQYGVEVADPGFQGVEVLAELLKSYFGHRIKRYIMGQILTSESEATGLGSGVADLHADTLLQILDADARNLEETLTSDLVETIIKINVSKKVFDHPGFAPRFKIETEEPDVDKIIEAWQRAQDMGLPLVERDLYDVIGASMPGPGDKILQPMGAQQPGGLPPNTSTDDDTSQIEEEPTDLNQRQSSLTELEPSRYKRPNLFRKSIFTGQWGLDRARKGR